MVESINFDANKDNKLSSSEIKELKATLDLIDLIDDNQKNSLKEVLLKLKKDIENRKIEVGSFFKENLLKLIDGGLAKLGYKEQAEQKDIKKDYTEDLESSYDKFVKELKERYSPDKVVFVVLGENMVFPVPKDQYNDIINSVSNNYYAMLKIFGGLYENHKIKNLGEDILSLDIDGYSADLYENLSKGNDLQKLFNLSKYIGDVAIAKPDLKSDGEYALKRTVTLNMTDPNLTEDEGDDIKDNIKDKLEDYNDQVNEYAEELVENNSLETVVNSYWNEFNDLIRNITTIKDLDKLNKLSPEIKKFFSKWKEIDLDKLNFSEFGKLNKYSEETFKKEFTNYLKENAIGGFVYKNGDWIFSKEALDTASKTGFLKGKVEYKDGDKIESKEVFMAIEKLKDQDKQNILKELDKYLPKELKEQNITTEQLISKLDGMVIDMEGAKIIIKGSDIYISKNREYSGDKLESIKIEAAKKLTSQNAKLVYAALGSSLLTAGLIKGFPKIDLPNIKVSLPNVKLDIPNINLKMNLPWNETVSGILSYFATSLVLNDKIAELKKENMRLKGEEVASDYLESKNIEINDKWKDSFKEYVINFEKDYLGGIKGDRQIVEGNVSYKNGKKEINDAWVRYPEYKEVKDAPFDIFVKGYKVDKSGNITDIDVKYDKGLLHKEKTYRFANIEDFNSFVKTGKLPDELKDEESTDKVEEEKDKNEQKENTNEFLKDKINDIAKELEDMGSWLGKTTFNKFEDGKYIFDVKGASTGEIILTSDGKLHSTKYEDMVGTVDLKEKSYEIAKAIKEFGDKIFDRYKK